MWCEKMLFHLLMSISIQSVIMAVALVPDECIFDNIYLVRIVACFMDDPSLMHKVVPTVGTAGYADDLLYSQLPL